MGVLRWGPCRLTTEVGLAGLRVEVARVHLSRNHWITLWLVGKHRSIRCRIPLRCANHRTANCWTWLDRSRLLLKRIRLVGWVLGWVLLILIRVIRRLMRTAYERSIHRTNGGYQKYSLKSHRRKPYLRCSAFQLCSRRIVADFAS
jgi:hypothetical protein